MVSICLEIKTECKHCGGSLVLNALVNEVLCPSCQKINEFPYEFWKKSILESALDEYEDLKEGEGQNQTCMTGEYTFQTMYGIQNPRCGKCKTYLKPEKFDEYVEAGKAVCGKCSNVISVRALPENLKSDFETVKYLIGEDPDMFTTGKGNVKTPESVKPILFTCPSCAGNLEIDGSNRVVTCKYCDSDIYLPDDLWFRMHPVKVIERWFIVLDDKIVSEKPIEWEYISDAVSDREGNLYLAAEDDDDHFLLWSMDKDFKTRWKVQGLEYSNEDTGLALTDDGKLYMADSNKHSLLVLSAKDGSIIKKIDGKEASAAEPEPFNMLETHSFTIDKDGSLLILKDNKILRFSIEGNRIPTWSGTETVKKKSFFSKLFGGGSEEPEEERYSPDVVEMKNKPASVDTDYTFVTLGWDGYIYFMESTSSEDASIAKYDREGNKLWNSIVPLVDKDSRPCIDKNGFVYVLGRKEGKYKLAKLNQNTMSWEIILQDIREGGTLNETEKLAITPDADRFYCFDSGNCMRVFDSGLNMIYISPQSKEDDEDVAKEHEKRIKNDEEIK
jgi:phage FluMu protein Com